MSRAELDIALLDAHRAGDGRTLAALYARAAEIAAEEEAQGFYLTHAYVFALESGDAGAEALHARLRAMGRER